MVVLLGRAVVAEIFLLSPLSLLELRNYDTEMWPFCGGEAPQTSSRTIFLTLESYSTMAIWALLDSNEVSNVFL